MWLEYLNHRVIQHQHNALKIPMLSCMCVHAMNLFCLVDEQLVTVKLTSIVSIALRSANKNRNLRKYFWMQRKLKSLTPAKSYSLTASSKRPFFTSSSPTTSQAFRTSISIDSNWSIRPRDRMPFF